jgi:hypothetical protein
VRSPESFSLCSDTNLSATVSFANPDAQFQLQWSDATGRHISLPTAIQQKIDTRSFAGQVSAAPNGAGFDLTVSWNLSDALAANAIASSTDAAGVTRYSVYIGYSLDAVAGQAPNYIEAKLENGVFVAHFNGVKDGARTLALQYAQPDGTLVSAAPLPVTTLVSLNQRYQRIEFSFPDLDTSNTQLVVRTRLAGSSGAWTSVPASAISGLSANLLGLAVSCPFVRDRLSRHFKTLFQNNVGLIGVFTAFLASRFQLVSVYFYLCASNARVNPAVLRTAKLFSLEQCCGCAPTRASNTPPAIRPVLAPIVVVCVLETLPYVLPAISPLAAILPTLRPVSDLTDSGAAAHGYRTARTRPTLIANLPCLK